MSLPYEETLTGEVVLRFPPGARHEAICDRLHAAVAATLPPSVPAELLEPRSVVQLDPGTYVRPDLAVVMKPSRKVLLAVEIIEGSDHSTDTVTKKQAYEDARVPRLWMVDPRYDNVEVYHCGAHGLALRHILAGSEALTEQTLPGLRLVMRELFGP
jgi:Uma2 family endonuclease